MNSKRFTARLFSVVMTICLVSGLSFGLGKEVQSLSNSTHICHESIINRIMCPFPFAAFHEMPVKKAFIGTGAWLFANRKLVHGVISVFVGWGLGTVQKIGYGILKEEYGKQYSQWVDKNFPRYYYTKRTNISSSETEL
ncbi:MAG: hypothetical protein LBJ98_00290 [Endomicrobium sp.]|jgi:hypothetical protein|nr:hypothetical protein [Endomicrobium sp.]